MRFCLFLHLGLAPDTSMFSAHYSKRCSYQHAELALSLDSALCCQRDLRLTYSIRLTCRSTCTYQHEACLTSSRKQLWSHLSIIYVSCFAMFHPHSEGPRSVLQIEEQPWVKTRPALNRPQEKHICFHGLKMARLFYVFTWNAVWTTVDAWNPL